MISGHNSYVTTKNGLIKINEISDEFIVVHDDNTQESFEQVKGIKQKEDDVYILLLNDGRLIEVTLDQKFMKYMPSKDSLPVEWMKLSELEKGDTILLSGWEFNGFNKLDAKKSYIDARESCIETILKESYIAYILGIINANKSLTTTLFSTRTKINIAQQIGDYWKIAFNETLIQNYNESGISIHPEETSNGFSYIREIIGDNKSIPDFILKSNRNIISKYLTGFFDNCNSQLLVNNQIAFFVQKFLLAHQLQYLLDKFSIENTVDYVNIILESSYKNKLQKLPLRHHNVWLYLFSSITNNYSLYDYNNLLFMDRNNYAIRSVVDIKLKGHEQVYALDTEYSYDVNGIVVKS